MGWFKKLFKKLAPIITIVVAVFAPEILPMMGNAIAAEAGITVSATTASAMGAGALTTTTQLLAGASPEDALKAGITAGVSAGVGGAVTTGVTEATGSTIVGSAAGSATKGFISSGGDVTAALTSAVAGASATAVASATDSTVAGKAVGAVIASGGVNANALLNFTASVAPEIRAANGLDTATTAAKTASVDTTATDTGTYQTPAILTAKPELVDAINNANLSPEDKAYLLNGIQGSQVAQALPSTMSDAGSTAAGRVGFPFAANDPRFTSALQNNPQLLQKFSEYTNTYGLNSPQLNVVYKSMIESELAKDPTYQPLLDEYKKVTGTDYKPTVTDLGEITITGKSTAIKPDSVVITIDAAKNKALVSDNTGKTSVVSIPPGITLKPNDAVAVDPKTGTILIPGTGPTVLPLPGTATSPSTAPGALPGALPGTDPNALPAVSPRTSPLTDPNAATNLATSPVISPATSPTFIPSTVSPLVPRTPTGPTKPVVKPNVYVDPTRPTDGTQPTDGVTPFDPTQPTEPTEPTEPTTPVVDPTVTTDPSVTPVDPTKTTEPEDKTITDPTITVVAPKKVTPKPRYPTVTGAGRSPLAQALTAFRPAGEIEGTKSGKPREDVWNEASLRLKDALGL